MNFLTKLFRRKPRVQRTDLTRRFDLVGRVGQGSMSKVWRARDTMTGRVVALKVLDREKTRRLEMRFQGLQRPSEGEVAVQLQHPHIVRTFEFGYTLDNEQFLVMEFVDGVGLSFLVDVQNELMQRNRLTFMIQLGEAIEYFHAKNFIHRDLCPRNVLVNEDRQVKLIDFGLVVPNTPDFQKPGNRTGTAAYMAPELIRRHRTDQRIDVFSYALTCYEMYTRRHPWEASATLDAALQHINQPPTDIRALVPEIDEQIAETIMKGVAVHPDQRWPSMRRMVDQFREARRRLEPQAEVSGGTPGRVPASEK